MQGLKALDNPHKGIRAEIDIEQRTLCALCQNALVGHQQVVHRLLAIDNIELFEILDTLEPLLLAGAGGVARVHHRIFNAQQLTDLNGAHGGSHQSIQLFPVAIQGIAAGRMGLHKLHAELLRFFFQFPNGLLPAVLHVGAVGRQGVDTQVDIAKSRLVELAECEELFAHPLHPYTRALLHSMPQLGVKGHNLFSIQGTPPNLFNAMGSFGTVFGLLFMICVFFAGFTSILGGSEALVATICDSRGWGRKKAATVIVVAQYLFSILFTLSFGSGAIAQIKVMGLGLFDFSDFIASLCMGLGALLMAVYVIRRWGFKKFQEEANAGATGAIRVYNWMKPYICIVFPVLLVVVIYWVVRMYV